MCLVSKDTKKDSPNAMPPKKFPPRKVPRWNFHPEQWAIGVSAVVVAEPCNPEGALYIVWKVYRGWGLVDIVPQTCKSDGDSMGVLWQSVPRCSLLGWRALSAAILCELTKEKIPVEYDRFHAIEEMTLLAICMKMCEQSYVNASHFHEDLKHFFQTILVQVQIFPWVVYVGSGGDPARWWNPGRPPIQPSSSQALKGIVWYCNIALYHMVLHGNAW